MGTEEDRLKLANIERRVQPDDPVNIQYTSVRFYLHLNKKEKID